MSTPLLGRIVAASLVAMAPLAAAEAESLVSYVHLASAGNITGELTALDHPLLNDRPGARLIVTQSWNPPGSVGVYNVHEVGVVYFPHLAGGGTWYVRSEDHAAIPDGAAFNVLIIGGDALSFVHLSHGGNTAGRATTLSPLDPDCLLCPSGVRMIYGHTYTVDGVSGGPFDHHASLVFVNPSYAIVTENPDPCCLDPMPTGVFFNVLVGFSPSGANSLGWTFQHVAAAATNAFNYTLLSHPELDGKPGAVAFAVRAGPAAGPNSAHVLGLWYAEPPGLWSVFFEDGAAMLVDSLYNVYIPPLMSDGFESGDTSWWSASVGPP